MFPEEAHRLSHAGRLRRGAREKALRQGVRPQARRDPLPRRVHRAVRRCRVHQPGASCVTRHSPSALSHPPLRGAAGLHHAPTCGTTVLAGETRRRWASPRCAHNAAGV
eukprot:scaffold176183_cov27-Tisochrysis_lutea.AAC.1